MDQVLYNDIGSGYNDTRLADPYIAGRLFHHLSPVPSGRYLDIGCGTGNYTKALAAMGLRMHGIDPSEKMLAVAKVSNKQISWLKGSADCLPVADNLFDGITGVLTIHHWPDLDTAFRELYRVLIPGGRIVFFTSTPAQMNGYWLNHYFPAMMRQSASQMPALDKLAAAAAKVGLEIIGTEKYFIKDNLKDHFLYVGKNKPELYFDQTIRNGISSFVALSNIGEVKSGLAMLRTDIDSDFFSGIRKRYDNETGDYLFVTLQKNN